jgi:hypothetical protein
LSESTKCKENGFVLRAKKPEPSSQCVNKRLKSTLKVDGEKKRKEIVDVKT